MKSLLTFVILAVSLSSAASAATTISCSSQTDKMISKFSYSFNTPLNLSVETVYDGAPLPKYIFLDEKNACGAPLYPGTTCSTQEIRDAINKGDYDFQFACSDGRWGEMHFENGVVMAYCYQGNVLKNQRGNNGCSIEY